MGKICSPCIQNALQNAIREYISRVSCHQDALFPSASLKSCTVGKSCHSFAILPFVRGPARDQRRGSSFTAVLACPPREGASAVAGGASVAVRPLRGGVSAVICPFRGDASTATKKRVQPKVPSWVRSSRNAFLSGKSWQYFVAMHSRRGATGRGTPSQIRRRLRGR